MSAADPPATDVISPDRLRYAGVFGRVVWRNLMRYALSPCPLEARPLRIPNRTPNLWAGWLGHATVLLHFFGRLLLTDPVLTNHLALSRRLVRLPLQPERIPPLDAVLITHAHCDHLHRASLRLLPRGQRIIVPHGCADLVADLGSSPTELGWGQEMNIGEVRIRAFRPRHWGRRPPLGGERGYNSYLLTCRGHSVLVAGDSAYTEAFQQACHGSHVSLALLSIGCYQPAFFRRAHLTPEDALRVFREIEADYMLPIHWGTFIISLEPPAQPARRLLAEATRLGLTERVRLVWPGGDFTYPGT
ncbi:MAG: MBL fold metallo-hydrolase [Pseudomonadota bacterium]